MTAVWQAGKTYVPGSLVKPLTTPPAVSAAPTNAGFETGDFSGWTASAGWSVVGGSQYAGTYCAQLAAAAGDNRELINANQVPVTPGQVINCSLRVKQGAAGSGNAGALVRIHWYDASHAEIGHNDGDAVFNGGGSYKTAYLRAVAPAGAAFAAFGVGAWDHSPSHPMWVDDAAWDYTYAGPVAGLIYKAVQDAPGKSGATEPAWPPVNGEQVIDNQVIWEAVLATRLVWQASPLMVSGTTEPDWPEVNGGTVRDGSIDWIAQTTQILDANCPHSKIVAIAAGKVYAADNDIIRYCATVNPLDWTSKDDAGYLPFGLQTYGSNPVAAMGLYRSNLVAFNTEGFQMWQVDEDPASTALLDALPIGSSQNRALAPVSNDLFFLASQGVRTVGIAAGSTNLQAGDVGMPVDALIKDAMASADAPPIATYVPSQGQYWITFRNWPPDAVALSGHLIDAVVGQTINAYAYHIGGGYKPILCTISDGALPDGLSLSSTGVVTGTPTTAGVFSWTVTATDAQGNQAHLPDSSSVASASFDPNITLTKYLLISFDDTTDRSGLAYDDSSWPLGLMPLGTTDRPDAALYGFPVVIQTAWPLTQNCWFRGRFNLLTTAGLQLSIYLDDAAEVWINGHFVFSGTSGGDPINYYFTQDIDPSVLVVGDNLVAVKCRADIFGINNYVSFRLGFIP